MELNLAKIVQELDDRDSEIREYQHKLGQARTQKRSFEMEVADQLIKANRFGLLRVDWAAIRREERITHKALQKLHLD